MARNAEKANAMLNRFLQAKKDAASGGRSVVERRPFRASEISEVAVCEKWRNSVIREVSRKVSEIQNATLGEHRIRELNDEINKLLREKRAWETQIKVLGGPDYAKTAPKVTDADGRGALGSAGYWYFGAAKDLPGVREQFEKQIAEATKRQRGELYQKIDADYYGYRDDDDGVLERLEKKQQEKLVANAIAEWRTVHEDEAKTGTDSGSGSGSGTSASTSSSSLRAHVELPSQEEIERMILEKKKAEIMAKYANI